LGSGDTSEAGGGGGGRWCGEGSVTNNRLIPCSWNEGENQVVLRCGETFDVSSSRTGVTEGPEGDGNVKWDGVLCIRCCNGRSCISSSGGVKLVAQGTSSTRGRGGGTGPWVVPDNGLACTSGVPRVTDGTEGFTPTGSELHDLGGEDTPTTGGHGGLLT